MPSLFELRKAISDPDQSHKQESPSFRPTLPAGRHILLTLDRPSRSRSDFHWLALENRVLLDRTTGLNSHFEVDRNPCTSGSRIHGSGLAAPPPPPRTALPSSHVVSPSSTPSLDMSRSQALLAVLLVSLAASLCVVGSYAATAKRATNIHKSSSFALPQLYVRTAFIL